MVPFPLWWDICYFPGGLSFTLIFEFKGYEMSVFHPSKIFRSYQGSRQSHSRHERQVDRDWLGHVVELVLVVLVVCFFLLWLVRGEVTFQTKNGAGNDENDILKKGFVLIDKLKGHVSLNFQGAN